MAAQQFIHEPHTPRYHATEKFIPYRKADLIEMVLAGGDLPEQEHGSFRELCRILAAIFHFDGHEKLETLKDCFAPFDPDADTLPMSTPTPEEARGLRRRFVEQLHDILTKANFEPIPPEDIQQSIQQEALMGVRLQVDLEDFDEMVFYRRGKHTRDVTVRSMAGLRKRTFEVVHYERVAMYVQLKDQAYFDRKGQKDLPFKPGRSFIKLFQDIPASDLEMLFPNAEARMRFIDKIFLGVPAALGGVFMVAKMGASLLLVFGLLLFWLGLRNRAQDIGQEELLALGAGIVALGGYFWRQLTKFKNRRIRFLKTLADNLYFKNLDNNAGVFHALIDTAEEEEFKEAILAYYFCLTREQGFSEKTLDEEIEAWFKEAHQVELDFEIDDAVAKLERLGLMSRDGEFLRCLPLDRAKEELDRQWDHYFKYHSAVAGP